MLIRSILFFFPLTSFFFSLFSFTLNINVGREDQKSFSTLHLREKSEFICTQNIDEYDVLKEVVCILPRVPKEDFDDIKTSFFSIDTFNQSGKYHVRIRPIKKIALFPIGYRLFEEGEISSFRNVNKAKHWLIVGYEEILPFINSEKTRTPLALNFPIQMAEVKMPSVGALDISGRPIKLSKTSDVNAYMRIKGEYESGVYDELANNVDALFRQYPDTIFKAELMLYKMRGFHHTNQNEELIRISKEFIYEYSDDENMAEVLAYTANSYSSVGMQSDADYFYERLFKEFPRSKFASLGMVYLGDQYSANGKQKPALSYYEKALYNTTDIEIASMAAIRLAGMNMEKGQLDKAGELYMKIVEGNGKYLLHDLLKNYDVARSFVNRGNKEVAVKILQAMLENLPQSDDNYESMVKDVGVWLAEMDKKPEAYAALIRYQELYGDSDYSAEVQKALDELFYIPEDANKSALLVEYEGLEKKYKNEELGQKASYQRAKLLYDEGNYQAVLDMQGGKVENEVGYFELKQKAAEALVLSGLKNKECAKAVALSNEYNLTLESKFDSSLYTCAFNTGNYKRAMQLAEMHINDKNERLLWLYRNAKTLNKLGEYEKFIDAAKDVITLTEIEETAAYDDILHDLFYAYERLKKQDEMIKTIKEVEARHGLEYNDIELYVSMIKLGLNENDDIVIQTYTTKVMALQEKTQSYSQSPFVEFAALGVLKAQKKDKEQIKLLRSLITRDLNTKDYSRAQYMLGSLLMKVNKDAEARTSFEESIKADGESAWGKLSKDALELL